MLNAYCFAKLKKEKRQENILIYLCDCLYLQGQNKCPSADIRTLLSETKQDNRTAEEIAAEVCQKAKLTKRE